MRYKALPLSVKNSPPSRPAPRPRRPAQSRSRLRDWLATIPMVLLAPALVLVSSQAGATTPTLSGPAVASSGTEIVIRGSGFPRRITVQLLWNGDAGGMAQATSDQGGQFSVALLVPADAAPGIHTVSSAYLKPGAAGNPAPAGNARSPGETLANMVIEVVISQPAVASSAPPSTVQQPAPEQAVNTPAPTQTPSASPSAAPTAAPTTAVISSPSPVPTPTATPSPVPTATATPAPTATATPVPVAVSAPTGAGIWISSSQLMSKPMSGAAWDAIAAQRLVGTGANLADQNSNHDVQTLGAALYAARTGDAATRARVIAALESAIGTEKGARWLAIGRNLGAYALAADLMGIHSGPIHNWLASFNTIKLAHNNNGTPITFRQSAWGSGSNASAQEGFAHAALNAYLGNRAELDWSWNAFRRYVGDRSSPHKISSNSDSWQQIPSDPVGIQNKGATKNGIRLDGAISNDMSRGGDFKWPPGYTAYPWVGLEGAVPAAVIFERAGYRAFAHQDAALGRAAAYLWFLRVETGDANWYDASRAKDIKHLLNAFYSLNYPAASPAGAGRTVGYTDWTHGR
jgi:hypothetical protein